MLKLGHVSRTTVVAKNGQASSKQLCCSHKLSSDSSNFAAIVLQQKENVQFSSNIAVSGIIAASSKNGCQQ